MTTEWIKTTGNAVTFTRRLPLACRDAALSGERREGLVWLGFNSAPAPSSAYRGAAAADGVLN
jgi:hypothetical protein